MHSLYCLHVSTIYSLFWFSDGLYVVCPLLLISFNTHLCHRRGAIVTTFIVCYALTSFISGYVNGGMYSRNGGKKLDEVAAFSLKVCLGSFVSAFYFFFFFLKTDCNPFYLFVR